MSNNIYTCWTITLAGLRHPSARPPTATIYKPPGHADNLCDATPTKPIRDDRNNGRASAMHPASGHTYKQHPSRTHLLQTETHQLNFSAITIPNVHTSASADPLHSQPHSTLRLRHRRSNVQTHALLPLQQCCTERASRQRTGAFCSGSCVG